MEVFILQFSNPFPKRIFTLLLVLSLLAASGCAAPQKPPETPAPNAAPTPPAALYQRPETVKSFDEAQKLLVEGNQRFTNGKQLNKDLGGARREELAAKGQKPFAIVVTCSDSRVPPELIFDQALGDLFVIRVAGNVVDPLAVGSVEYGAEHLKAPLVVVMGHEKCGAVKATVDGGEAPGSIGTIVEKIKPALSKAKASGATGDELAEKTADENIRMVIVELEKSPILKHLAETGQIKIIGAKYLLGTGKVEYTK